MSAAPDIAGPAVAIILGRAGSKGLPRKNALPVAGRPCVEHTLAHACEAATVGPIILSTDDAELLAIGRAWSDRMGGRVRVHTRPSELASDTATIDAAARGVLTAMSRGDSAGVTCGPHTPIVILYANVPVRPAGLIDRAVQLLSKARADSVQSYAPVGKYHPWWIARVDPSTGAVRPWEGSVLNHGVYRRQDLPPAFIPDGGVIVCTREALMLEIPGVSPGPHAFFGRDDRRRGVINPEGSVIDIDTLTDLLVAEAVLTRRAGVQAHGNQGPQ